jgi:hypothetical protein
MYQQLWGYKVEEKLYLGVREQKMLNTTALNDALEIKYSEQAYYRKYHPGSRVVTCI